MIEPTETQTQWPENGMRKRIAELEHILHQTTSQREYAANKRAEQAEAENVRLREAVEAEVLWHDSEDDHKTTTFDERMDLCHYSEWLAKRAIGRDVTDEYEGIPRLVLNLRDRAEEGGGDE